ncbi:MAG: SGNH/GDSL hydrolase family protein [Elusimicrobiota bacterium]
MTRRRLGAVLMGLGALLCFSDSIVAAAMSLYWNAHPVDPYSVGGLQEQYARWALAFGIAIFGMGIVIRRRDVPLLANLSLTTAALAVVVLGDRILLLALGLPLWIPDIDSHYRQRPNAVRSWSNGKLIRINRYGFHDEEFPIAKEQGELRGVMLGDSVTMGHGLAYEEAFPYQLEQLLRQSTGNRAKVKIINTGVQGYSTYQEANAFERSLRFKPDFAAIGFCMNDVTEPYEVDRRFGGVGLNYHQVLQLGTKSAMYLVNETGIGRTILKIQKKPREQVLQAKSAEVATVGYMASHPADDPKTALGWTSVLQSLGRMQMVARDNHVGLVLLVFPFTFQLFCKECQRPQSILLEYGRQHGLEVIDFTPIFEDLLSGGNAGKDGLPDAARYFLDEDHFTAEGHRIVAERMLLYVKRRASAP